MVKRYSTPKEYLDAPGDPQTSAEELRELARCEYDFVRTTVAAHPNTDRPTLEFLLPADPRTWNEQDLLARIAAHAHATPELLKSAARIVAPLLDNARGNDRGMAAGIALCCNEHTPVDAIRALLAEPTASTAFRKKLAGVTARRDVLALLAEDRSETVRGRALATLAALGSPQPLSE
jgi:hypothetical protein